ncbi:MAG: hypothetical protein ACOCVD_02535 [Bacillota bacterium]
MNFKANRISINSLKEGMKLTVHVGQHEEAEALRDIHKLINQPLQVKIELDQVIRDKQINEITESQKREIVDLFDVISQQFAYDLDKTHLIMKDRFIQDKNNKWKHDFSLDNCSQLLADDFICWLIDYCYAERLEPVLADVDPDKSA